MGSCSLLQGIFPIQESNPGLLHCRWILYQLSHQGSPDMAGGIFFLFIFFWQEVFSIHNSFPSSQQTEDLTANSPFSLLTPLPVGRWLKDLLLKPKCACAPLSTLHKWIHTFNREAPFTPIPSLRCSGFFRPSDHQNRSAAHLWHPL